MNPLTLTARAQRLESELRRIREAWPGAVVTRGGPVESPRAVAMIAEAGCVTYVIEVTPDSSRSLWVKHGPDGEGETAGWRDGWVD